MGRTSDASEDVAEEAEVVCSVRIVVLCAMHAYRRGVGCDEEEAILRTTRGCADEESGRLLTRTLL